MAAEVRSLLKAVGDSGSHKDVAQKYKNILSKVLAFKEPRLTEGMKAFIEAGRKKLYFRLTLIRQVPSNFQPT